MKVLKASAQMEGLGEFVMCMKYIIIMLWLLLGVLDCVFHPSQPWLFTAGADSVVRLYCN